MEKESRNKTLSSVLITVGIILSIGGLIAMIGNIAGIWSLPEFDAYGWLFGAIVGGFNIWCIGILIGRLHRLDKKSAKDIKYLKIIVAVALIGHLATAFGNDVLLIKDPSLGLNELFNYILCGCLGVGIARLSQTRKSQSDD